MTELEFPPDLVAKAIESIRKSQALIKRAREVQRDSQQIARRTKRSLASFRSVLKLKR